MAWKDHGTLPQAASDPVALISTDAGNELTSGEKDKKLFAPKRQKPPNDLGFMDIEANNLVVRLVGAGYSVLRWMIGAVQKWGIYVGGDSMEVVQYKTSGTPDYDIRLTFNADGNVTVTNDLYSQKLWYKDGGNNVDVKAKLDDLGTRLATVETAVPYTGGAGIKIDGKTISATADDPAVKPVMDIVTQLQKNVEAIKTKVNA